MSVNKLTQSLANSQSQDDRDVAIENVMKWIKAQKEITEVDFAKLWQGLYYCYWLADKQIYQDDVCDAFAETLLEMKEQNAMLYLKTFYDNMLQNWVNLDKHRVAKYLTLLRRFTQATLQFLKKKKYALEWLYKLNDLMTTGPFNLDRSLTDGLRIFLGEIILAEIGNHAQDMPSDAMVELLRPYFVLFATTQSTGVFKRLREELILPALDWNSEEATIVAKTIDFAKISQIFAELEETLKARENKMRCHEYKKEFLVASVERSGNSLFNVFFEDLYGKRKRVEEEKPNKVSKATKDSTPATKIEEKKETPVSTKVTGKKTVKSTPQAKVETQVVNKTPVNTKETKKTSPKEVTPTDTKKDAKKDSPVTPISQIETPIKSRKERVARSTEIKRTIDFGAEKKVSPKTTPKTTNGKGTKPSPKTTPVIPTVTPSKKETLTADVTPKPIRKTPLRTRKSVEGSARKSVTIDTTKNQTKTF